MNQIRQAALSIYLHTRGITKTQQPRPELPQHIVSSLYAVWNLELEYFLLGVLRSRVTEIVLDMWAQVHSFCMVGVGEGRYFWWSRYSLLVTAPDS